MSWTYLERGLEGLKEVAHLDLASQPLGHKESAPMTSDRLVAHGPRARSKMDDPESMLRNELFR